MDNPEKLPTQSTQDEEKQSKKRTQHNMFSTPPHANKYKQRKQDMIPPTNNSR